MSTLIALAATFWVAAATPPTNCMTDAFRVYFERDKALGDAANTVVSEAAMAWLRAPEGTRLIVLGHTDRVGDAVYNVGLSERVARDVETRLMAFGVSPDAILLQSYGEARPEVETPDGQAEQRNNRVEIWLRGPEPVCPAT